MSTCKGSCAQTKNVKVNADATIAFLDVDFSPSKVDWDTLEKGGFAYRDAAQNHQELIR